MKKVLWILTSVKMHGWHEKMQKAEKNSEKYCNLYKNVVN